MHRTHRERHIAKMSSGLCSVVHCANLLAANNKAQNTKVEACRKPACRRRAEYTQSKVVYF